jgi:uncharacterized protein (DUF58 family)
MNRVLIPQRKLLVAVGIGAAMIALATLAPAVWVLVIVYHGYLVVVTARDAARLPGRAGFKVIRDIPRPFSLGAVQEVVIVVHHPRAAGLRATVADHAPRLLHASPRVVGESFDGDGVMTISYDVQPPHRGAFRFGPVDIRCWRPSGWWVRQARVPLEETASVYPDIIAIKRFELLLRRGLRMMEGQRRARPPGASTAFAGLREYLPGDDIRRIGWKATARRDHPITVEMEAERGQQVIIALDCGRLMTAPAGVLTKLDNAVNAALLLAWVAQSQGDRVGMIAFSDRVTRYLAPRRGMRQVHIINELLYDVRAEYTEPDFATAFTYVALRVSRRSLVIVLTDVLDREASQDLVAHVLRLGRRHRVLVVAMSDPALLAARDAPLDRSTRAYEWAAAEELLDARRQSFDAMQRGGVLSLDVPAGRLSPALVERYLEMKERALL